MRTTRPRVVIVGAVSELLRRVLTRDHRAIPRGTISVVLLDWARRYLCHRPASALIVGDSEPGERESDSSTLRYRELDSPQHRS